MEEPQRKLAAILSADVVGYTRLMAHDEFDTVRTLNAFRGEIERMVIGHAGRTVDSPGDNLLAEFPSALAATPCALEVQRALAVRNAELAAERNMMFRIGVHLGDVLVEGERIYGDGVNIAARLEALADPGGVCISAAVHDQVEGKLSVAFSDRGDQRLKNLPRPVRVFALRPEGPPSREQSREQEIRFCAASDGVSIAYATS